MKKVLGLGNALVDILISLDDDKLLEEFSLPKGSMQLVDSRLANQILEETPNLKKSFNSGGSAANTINGLAHLGVPTGYIGAVGEDNYANYFMKNMEAFGTKLFLNFRNTETGSATTLITPDSERTFATCLGAAVELDASMLKPDFFRNYDYFHIEGYMASNQVLFLRAMELARENKVKISMDMASYNIVEGNLDFFKQVIRKYVDIVFSNEEEAKAFTGKEPEEALGVLASQCDIAVVKIGKKGSLVQHGSFKHHIGVLDVRSVDTTGAGDLYASGFLYGMVKDYPLEKCGILGSVLSGLVIESIGARMNEEQWSFAEKKIREL